MTRRYMIHKRRMMRRKQTRVMCVFLNFGPGHALVRIVNFMDQVAKDMQKNIEYMHLKH